MRAIDKARLLLNKPRHAKEDNSTIYETVFKETPVVIILLDRDSRIVKTNNAFQEVFGNGREMEGGFLGDIVPDGTLQRHIRELLKKENGKRELELCMDTTASGRKILRVVLTRINRPAADGILLMMEDLSETVRFEEQMLQMEKIFAVGQLTAGIVHEIGNPLGIMKTSISFLNDHLSQRGDELTTYTDVLMENIDRMHELLKGISGCLRPQNDQFDFHDISKCISPMIHFIGKECEKKGIVIDASFEDRLSPVYCNPYRMKQVFLNLFKNAIEAMPAGGRLTIKVSSLKEQNMIRIDIMDSGQGIQGHELNCIFRPFYTTKKDGSGLGLFITRNIIREHDGSISAKSTVGKGSVFTIILPNDKVVE